MTSTSSARLKKFANCRKGICAKDSLALFLFFFKSTEFRWDLRVKNYLQHIRM